MNSYLLHLDTNTQNKDVKGSCFIHGHSVHQTNCVNCENKLDRNELFGLITNGLNQAWIHLIVSRLNDETV